MKTRILLLSVVLLPLALCRGDTGLVYDQATDNDVKQVDKDVIALNTMASTALDKANGYLKQIQDTTGASASDIHDTLTAVQGLVKVIGDPSKITGGGVTQKSVQAVKSDITSSTTKGSNYGTNYSTTPLQHFKAASGGIPSSQTPAITGREVYNETAGGLYPTTIGSQYKAKPSDASPNTDRTASSYMPEASEIATVNDYYKVRDAALNRREALQTALADAVDQLDRAPDFATVEKLTALIQALQGQMQQCNDDIHIAFNDMAVRGMQVYAMNSITTKATAEPMMNQVQANIAAAVANAQHPPEPLPPTAFTPYTATGTSGTFLPWPVIH